MCEHSSSKLLIRNSLIYIFEQNCKFQLFLEHRRGVSKSNQEYSGADPGFPVAEAILPNFPKNQMKLRQFWAAELLEKSN